jgi:spermidine/putrescine-binding protein
MAGAGGSPYCSVADVAALSFGRAIGVGSNPGPSQVWTYINMTAGEIDAVLTKMGYSVPVNIASYPEAAAFLNSVNAKGAWAMMESSAPTSPNLDRAKAAYDEAMKMLADAEFVLEAAVNLDRARVRAPFLTLHPTGDTFDPTVADTGGFSGDGISNGIQGNPANPYFSRQQRF